MLSEYKYLGRLLRKIKEHETILVISLMVISVLGLSLGGRLSALKKQNTELSENVQKLEEYLVRSQQEAARSMDKIIKDAISSKRDEDLAEPLHVVEINGGGYDPEKEALRAENMQLRQETADLRNIAAQLRSKSEAAAKEGAFIKKQNKDFENSLLERNNAQIENDYMRSENARLQEENEALRSQNSRLQLELIRVFNEPGPSGLEKPIN